MNSHAHETTIGLDVKEKPVCKHWINRAMLVLSAMIDRDCKPPGRGRKLFSAGTNPCFLILLDNAVTNGERWPLMHHVPKWREWGAWGVLGGPPIGLYLGTLWTIQSA
jgi:hypothetical protein